MIDQRIVPYPYEIHEPTYKKRYHKDVNFETDPLPLNQFSIYQVCDLACSSDHTVREHRQICHEISYIVSGEGTFYRNGKSFPVHPNMIFLVNDQDVHSVKSSRNAPLRFMCLGFSFRKDHPDYEKYEHVEQFLCTMQNPLAIDKSNLFSLFSLALSEASSHDPLSVEMFESYIRQIIVQTYRNYTSSNTRRIDLADINDTNPLVYEITNYVDTNLMNIKKLSDITDVFDYSYGYLSRTFSQVMGMTIKDYFTQRRLEKAAELLAEGISVTNVSERLLFADVPSFCKAFKRCYHISPKKYQTMMTAKSDINEILKP